MDVRKIGLVGLACLLAACGGGGQTGEQGAPQQPSGPKTYVAAAATVGDYFSYKQDSKIDGQANSSEYFTNLVSNVAQDGAKSVKFLADYVMMSEPLEFSSSTSTDEFDSTGRQVSSFDGFCTTTFKPSFYYVAPNTISAGMSWQHTGLFEYQCGTSTIKQTTMDYKNTVGNLEQVTVAAGTFSAFKVTLNSTSESTTTTSVGERSCWWAPELGAEVKCSAKIARTVKATGAIKNMEVSYELQGFAVQKLARKSNTVQRFMGTWKGNFNGAASGTCALTFAQDGTINGNCSGAAIGFGVKGKIDADGNLTLNLVSNGVTGQTFTGKVDSLQQISGVWSVPNYGNGTWTITQD